MDIIFYILITLALIFLYVRFRKSTNTRNDQIQLYKKKQNKILREHGATISREIEWIGQYSLGYYRVIIDDVNRMVYFSKGVVMDTFERHPYSKIIGFDVSLDGDVDYNIYKSFVSKRKTVNSFAAVVYLDSVSKPRYVFDFIKRSTDISNPNFISSQKFVEELGSVIKVIVEKNNRRHH